MRLGFVEVVLRPSVNKLGPGVGPYSLFFVGLGSLICPFSKKGTLLNPKPYTLNSVYSQATLGSRKLGSRPWTIDE